MNTNIHSFIDREISPVLKEYLTLFPVVCVTGPRQSGKSTLLQHVLPDYTYVTFDDFMMREEFLDDPVGFMNIYHDRVIFDEVQKVPEIFDHIKMAVDRDRMNYGKYVITGSSQFTLNHHISESLAGRLGPLTLLTFDAKEIPEQSFLPSQFRGSYPELVMREYRGDREWYAAYVDTYLQKDVRELRQVGNIRDFGRFISLLAANTSQLLNLSYYARDLGVSVKTIRSWVSVLEASYIIFLLPPYHKNLGKRLIKSPKVYFWDTGLVSFLTGVRTEELYRQGPLHGALFENYIVSEVKKRIYHENTMESLWFFRDSNGLEVDLIIEGDSVRQWIEIKTIETYKPAMVRPILRCKSPEDQGLLVYKGESRIGKEGVHIVNFEEFLKRS